MKLTGQNRLTGSSSTLRPETEPARWGSVLSGEHVDLRFRIWLTENELANEFSRSFEERRLEEKFFYWLPLSVRAWLELCTDGAYRNFIRSQSLLSRSSKDIASHLAGTSLSVLSIGSGQGDKDLFLLKAVRNAGVKVVYLPFDASQSLLEIACLSAARDGFTVEGIKGDFTRDDHLRRLVPGGPDFSGSEAGRRLIMMIGNTLGCLDPIAAASQLSTLLGPEDLLLVDGELYSDETLAGYDNPINRRFAWGPLNSVGITEDDGQIVFEQRKDERLSGLRFVSKHFEADRDAEALLGGETFHVEQGDRLEMSHSYKYSDQTFYEILGQAGLSPLWKATSDDNRLLMVLAAPAE